METLPQKAIHLSRRGFCALFQMPAFSVEGRAFFVLSGTGRHGGAAAERKGENHMRSSKPTAALLAIALTLGLSACAPSVKPPAQSDPAGAGQPEGPVTVINYNYQGQPVTCTYDAVPQRVVAVYQGCIETMIALGLEEHVIASYGLDNQVKEEWQAGFEKMHYHEEVFAPDRETMTLLEPDFIFSWGSLFGEKKLGDVDWWNERGVGTYMSGNTVPGGGRTLENEYQDLLNIGAIFRVEERAQALVDEMRGQVAEITSAVAGEQPVRVAVVEPISGTITNYGEDSLAGDMVMALGGELACPQVGEIGKENLIAGDPDVIFAVYMAYSGDNPESVRQAQLSLIWDDPALSSLKAVQEGRVYPIMLGDMYASGPRTVDGLKTLAAGMYPQLSW